jgi:hypothetical protein
MESLQPVYCIKCQKQLAVKGSQYCLLHSALSPGKYCAECGVFLPQKGDKCCIGCKPRQINGKRKAPSFRKSDSPFDESDFYESEDDDQSISPEERFLAIAEKSSIKKKKVKLNSIPTEMVGKQLVYVLHDPAIRKTYATIRSNNAFPMEEYLKIGHQILRIGSGKGHFVQAGGMNTDRPKNVKEPPHNYHELLTNMLSYGYDENTKALYEMATGQEFHGKKHLADSELAQIILHYINHDAQEIEQKLEARTQLTEHLSKLAAIFDVAERARGMEAKPPHDAAMMVRICLYSVAAKKRSLKQAFFEGDKGIGSDFLGAPTDGGAAFLRFPTSDPGRFANQMELWSDKKSEFKELYNNLRGRSGQAFTPLTLKEEADNVVQAFRVHTAKELLKDIKETKLDLDFAEGKGAKTYYGFNETIRQYRSNFEGNSDVLKILDECQMALNQMIESSTNQKSQRARVPKNYNDGW